MSGNKSRFRVGPELDLGQAPSMDCVSGFESGCGLESPDSIGF